MSVDHDYTQAFNSAQTEIAEKLAFREREAIERIARNLCARDDLDPDQRVFRCTPYETHTPNGRVYFVPLERDMRPLWEQYARMAEFVISEMAASKGETKSPSKDAA